MKQLINTDTLSNLTTEQRETAETLIHLSSFAVWNATSKNFGVEFDDFKHDKNCVKYIEEYLNLKIKSRILKWEFTSDRAIKLIRVRTNSGVPTSNVKHIQDIFKLINSVSMLFGQCILNTYGGKWEFKDEKYYLDVPGAGGLFTSWKCLKFVTFGIEDSLIGYLNTIGHHEQNRKTVEELLNIAQELGTCPEHYTKQLWTDDIGKLVKLVLIDRDTGKEAVAIEIGDEA